MHILIEISPSLSVSRAAHVSERKKLSYAAVRIFVAKEDIPGAALVGKRISG